MISVASYAQASWPGIRDWFGMAYERYPAQWTEIFDQYTSDKNFERDVMHGGLGLFRVKPEQGAITYDDMSQIRKIDYEHVTYALGFLMSRESMEDNLYPQLSEQRAKELGDKASLTQETLAATWMSRVFSGSYLQSDGKAVCASDHPLQRGGTASNIPSAAVDFSEAALEDAIIQIQQQVGEDGLRINLKPMKIIAPPQLQFDIKRVLGNDLRPGTAERDINALVQMGMIPEGYRINNYLTDTDAWFIKTSAPNGLKHYSRRPVELSNDTMEFDTEAARFKCTFRDSRGISDWRALWGSAGA